MQRKVTQKNPEKKKGFSLLTLGGPEVKGKTLYFTFWEVKQYASMRLTGNVTQYNLKGSLLLPCYWSREKSALNVKPGYLNSFPCLISFPKESHSSRKSISASFSAHKSNLLMPQVHCPARPIPPAPARSTLPCIHPLSLCPSCLLLIAAHHRCECPYGCRVGHKGVAAGKVSILMHCDLQPSPWCCVQRAPRDRLSANIHAQDGGGGGPHLVQLPPCQG